MKILLLSDIPPCENFTAGLVLSAMARLVPRDEICCFTVANPTLDMQLAPEFSNIPIEVHAKPNENWAWLPRRRFVRRLSSVASFAGECITEQIVVRALIRKAVSFGRKQRVDRVWAVLQGQTMIRMAQAVADQLGVPLYTHVWDPFSWWAKANCLDGITTHRVQSMFDNAIRHSRCVATASEPMADLYRDRFGVSAIPVIASHPKSMAQAPDLAFDDNTPIVIGMAGQFYAASEWLQLHHALRASNWRVAGRPVRIIVMGPQRPPGAIDEHISFLGWKSQQDAALILSQCDVLYCPYPFDPGMKEVSQYSFPSKLVLYLAAGRPILFHGPDYSSPAHYIKSRKCGLIASRLVATAVYNELERVVRDCAAYRTMATNAQAAFINDFTLESMDRSFNMFIGGQIAEGNCGARLFDHRAHHQGFDVSTARLSDTKRNRSFVWVALKVAQMARARYAHLRRQLKSHIRRLALQVPRFQSLYHEIHALYANNAALQQKIVVLESENARLNALLLNGPATDNGNDVLKATSDEMSPLSSINISLQFVSDLYPKTKTLVLTRSHDKLESYLGARKTDTTRLLKPLLMIESVAYAESPIDSSIGIGWTDDWHTISNLLPSSAVSSVLRLVLQEGFERIVVAGNIPSDIALAAEVSRLASQRMTVVATVSNQPSGWLWSQKQIDFIAAPAKLHKHEQLNLQDCRPSTVCGDLNR